MANGIKKINENVLKPQRTLVVTDQKALPGNFEVGTIFIDTVNRNLKLKWATTWESLVPTNIFQNGSMTTSLFADRSVTYPKLALNCVKEDILGDRCISSRTVIDNAIIERHLGAGIVSTTKYADNSISTVKYMDKSITKEKLANASVGTTILEDKAVNSSKLADSVVLEKHLAGLSVNDTHIKDAVIKRRHLSDGCIGGLALEDFSITESKYASSSIPERAYKNESIESRTLGNSSVITSKIADKNVTDIKLSDSLLNKIDSALRPIDGKIQANVPFEARMRASVYESLDVFGSATVSGNITAQGTITANKVYNAYYNDYAEGFIPAEKGLEPGDVVAFDENGHVKKAEYLDPCTIGVVSDQFGILLGATEKEIINNFKIAVGFLGRLKVKVKGFGKRGDYIVAAGNGYATIKNKSGNTPIIGRLMEDKTDYDVKEVMCYININ